MELLIFLDMVYSIFEILKNGVINGFSFSTIINESLSIVDLSLVNDHSLSKNDFISMALSGKI